jgi:hypothetical protein
MGKVEKSWRYLMTFGEEMSEIRGNQGILTMTN